LPNEPERR